MARLVPCAVSQMQYAMAEVVAKALVEFETPHVGDIVRATDHCGSRKWQIVSIAGDSLLCKRVKADQSTIQLTFDRYDVEILKKR